MPRAKLRALLSIFEGATPSRQLTIRVDASYLLGLRDDPAAKAKADNGDMWVECWRLRVDIIKIPRSHATDAMETTRIITRRDRIGNGHADKLAEKRALLSVVPEDNVLTTHRVYRLARYVQLRLAQASVIHTSGPNKITAKATPPAKAEKRPPPPSTQANLARLRTERHSLFQIRHRAGTIYRCAYCSGSCAAGNLRKWSGACTAAKRDRTSDDRARPAP